MAFPEGELTDLGVGIGHREEIHDAIMANRDAVDWVEIITDRHLGQAGAPGGADELRALRDSFVVVPHGLEMSVGSEGPLDEEYLDAVGRVADLLDAPWVSDHLCFTRDGGVELANLTPVVRTRRRAREIAAKAQHVQDRLGRLFLLENITYYLDLPGELTESELIVEVLENCDCGLLLDLNNVLVNARNHGFDPYAFLDGLPLHRVVQVHLAGNSEQAGPGGIQLDGHDAPVGEDVFDLLRYLVDRVPPKGVLIERDDLFPADFGELAADLERARTILANGRWN